MGMMGNDVYTCIGLLVQFTYMKKSIIYLQSKRKDVLGSAILKSIRRVERFDLRGQE